MSDGFVMPVLSLNRESETVTRVEATYPESRDVCAVVSVRDVLDLYCIDTQVGRG